MPSRAAEQRVGFTSRSYGAEHETGIDRHDAWQFTEMFPMDALIIVEIAADDFEPIILAARHEGTFHNPFDLGNGRLERRQILLYLGAERDIYQCRDAKTESAMAETCAVSRDSAGILQCLDAPRAGGLGKARPLGNLADRQASVVRQGPHYRLIDAIQMLVHEFLGQRARSFDFMHP